MGTRDFYAAGRGRTVNEAFTKAVEDAEWESFGPDYFDGDTPDDTPSLENCDDWGTGEGKFHGRC